MVSHWLMKTEPETFGIDDLERVKVEPWTGVRNYMARNLMRDRMQVGDEVLFYHSSCEPPGVAGLARVVRTGVVDATQFDPASQYHDPDSGRDEPRWICVDVAFVRRLPRFVSLGELRAHPRLASMQLLQRGSRLSVQPVSAEHYGIIVGLADAPAPEAASAAKARPAAKAKPTKAPAAKAKPARGARARATKTPAAKAEPKPKQPTRKTPSAKAKPKPKQPTTRARARGRHVTNHVTRRRRAGGRGAKGTRKVGRRP